MMMSALHNDERLKPLSLTLKIGST